MNPTFTISCIAIDDEPLALEKMESYIAKIDYLQLVRTFDNGVEALQFLRKNQVDLLFLDVQMDELTGIQLLEVLKNKPRVILTTAYDQYALKGYELDIIDYLLKPISFQRFLMAVEKAYEIIRTNQNQTTKETAPTTKTDQKRAFILVRSEYKLLKIWIDEILYVEGMKDYSRIHCADRRIMTMQNLKKMEEHLPPPLFFRVHKSYIVPVNKIDSIEKNAVEIGDQSIPIGSLYRKNLLDFLESQQML